MLFDADATDRGVFARTFDVCVVGAGPAGITVARRLAARGLDVALMEAGGLDYSDQSQDFYRGAVVGHEYHATDVTRLRYFGGTSNHWGGRCRTLEAHDFEAHAFHALSGWPIGKGALDPYRDETDAILDLPSAEHFPDRPAATMAEDFTTIRFRMSPPTRFGEKYRDEIIASERIRLVLNANLVDLRLGPDLASVTEAVFKSYTPGDPGFLVKARAFCLCLGGLENPRMLLNARGQLPAGIGNAHDLVGRFFCEHIGVRAGKVLFADTVWPSADYGPTPEMMRARGALDFNLILKTEAMSLKKEFSRSLICATPFTERLAAQVLGWKINCDTGGMRKYLAAAWADEEARGGQVSLVIEQALNPDSRVRLSEERDAFGLQRLALDWRVSALDYHTLRSAMLTLGERLAEQGAGRVQLQDWLLAEPPVLPPMGQGDEIALHHHMCTTRMSADPRTGVVDADCRVHGMANLYLGGSSVFASAGHANPTYTVVQLALRLGDHLSGLPRA